MANEINSEVQICSLNGAGNARTKPFVIAEGFEYFTIRWTMGSDDGEIDLYSLEDSTYPVDSFSGAGPSETVWYSSGKFFFAVKSNSEWSIHVVIEPEALSDRDHDESSDEEEEVVAVGEASDVSLMDRQLQFISLDSDNWFYVYATYSQELFRTVMQSGLLNYVNSVIINPSENLISSDGLVRLQINSRIAEKLYETANNLQRTVLNLIPDVQDNYPQSPTVQAIDERRLNVVMSTVYKMRYDLSKILAKCGSADQKFTFGDPLIFKGNPGVRLQLFTVSASLYRGDER